MKFYGFKTGLLLWPRQIIIFDYSFVAQFFVSKLSIFYKASNTTAPFFQYKDIFSYWYRPLNLLCSFLMGNNNMCIKKPVNHFAQNCTCAKRISQWASIEEFLMSS